MSFRDESNGRRAFPLPGSKLQYGPDKTVQVEHIDLHLTPDFEREALDGICTTTVRALDEDVASLTLDAVDLRHCRRRTERFVAIVRTARRKTRHCVRPADRRRGECDDRRPLPRRPSAPRSLFRQAHGRASEQNRTLLDAEPRRKRPLLVPVPRSPAFETDDVDHGRRSEGHLRVGKRRARRA